jgi:hypothetical protein
VTDVKLWRRRREPARQPPTSDDPVGAALAEAGQVVSRFEGEQLDVNDLREIVGVMAVNPRKYDGFTTVIGLHDEIWSYADTYGDGLESALADQPGIEEVLHVEREELVVRTSLSLPDVHAAAIRALLEINRRPRHVPEPERLPSLETVRALEGESAAMLAAHGFDGAPDARGFHRAGADGLIQRIRFGQGEGTVILTFDVLEPDIAGLTAPVWGWDALGVPVAHKQPFDVPPTGEGVSAALAECLPWFDTVDSRAAIVSGWVRDPRPLQPPAPLWEKIDVAARWGLRDQALALLRYGRRKEWQHRPRFVALAEKYQLPF